MPIHNQGLWLERNDRTHLVLLQQKNSMDFYLLSFIANVSVVSKHSQAFPNFEEEVRFKPIVSGIS